MVQRLAADGVDLIKVALEPAAAPAGRCRSPPVVRAIVERRPRAGLPVVAHALTVELVQPGARRRRGRAGAHPDRAASAGAGRADRRPAGSAVTSTLQTFFAAGFGRDAAANAADLVAAGVRLRYGTDLGNAGTRPGGRPARARPAGRGRPGPARRAAGGHRVVGRPRPACAAGPAGWRSASRRRWCCCRAARWSNPACGGHRVRSSPTVGLPLGPTSPPPGRPAAQRRPTPMQARAR